jgi:peptide/nickel transport system permease protein
MAEPMTANVLDTGTEQPAGRKLRPAAAGEVSAVSQHGQLSEALHRLTGNRVTLAGTIVVALLIIVALFADQLAPYDPIAVSGLQRLSGPSLAHPFGTDHLGRDVLSRVIFGARTSLLVGVVSITAASICGIVLGLSSAYIGGIYDEIILRLSDILFGIPALLLAIALSAVLGTGLLNPIVAIIVINIPFFIRMVRAPALVEQGKEYVAAAIVAGASTWRILFKYILPNVMPLLIIQASLNISYAILVEASLGFVGLGVQPPTPSWGGMLNEGRTFLELAPWVSVFPGLAITVTVLAFNLTGDGLRDALDPMMRGRR